MTPYRMGPFSLHSVAAGNKGMLEKNVLDIKHDG